MDNDVLLEEIRQHNLAYLILVQKMLVSDTEVACVRLGITEALGQRLAKLSVQEMTRMSQISQLLCRLPYVTPEQIDALVQDREHSMYSLQSALVLASSPVKGEGKGA